MVWARLRDLLGQSVLACVAIEDEARLRAAAAAARLPDSGDARPELLAFDLLRRRGRRAAGLSDLGLRAVPAAAAERPAETAARIDREFYLRSVAHYERSFRVLAR